MASSVQATLYLMETCRASLDPPAPGKGGRVILASSSTAVKCCPVLRAQHFFPPQNCQYNDTFPIYVKPTP